MNRTMLKFLIVATIASTLAVLYHPCYAQARQEPVAWPTKPIRLVVGFPPGGAGDVTARLIANQLGIALGQQVFVENRPGAGSTLGAAAVAHAAPDGYTLLMGSSSNISIAPHVYRQLPYDPRRDFVPASVFGHVPLTLVVHPSVPAHDLKGLVELLRNAAGSFNYGSFGTGSSSHLGMEMFKHAAGVQMTHVPYKGSTPMLNDLLGGQVPVSIDLIQNTQAHIRAATLRPLAISAAQRTPLAPDVPTFVELGYPELVFSAWQGVFLPVRTPDAIVKRLETEISRIVNAAETRARFEQLGIERLEMSGSQTLAFLEKDSVLWGEAARVSGAQLD